MAEGYTQRHRELLRELLCDLVSIPTQNRPPRGFEAEGQRYFKAFCLGLGLCVDEFSPADLPEYPQHPEFLPRDFDGRRNIVGILRGTGGGRSLLLTGHMDVAPEEPLAWTVTEPFAPRIVQGRLYGRGAADMKGGLACAMTAVRMLVESGQRLRGDVLLESVVDEEYAGANGTIACRLRPHTADFGILLEPSGLNVCPATLGGLVFVLSFQGTAGMPYTGEALRNPALDLAEALTLIREFGRQRAARRPRPALWKEAPQDLQTIVTKVRAGEAYESGQLSLPMDAWLEAVVQTYPGEDDRQVEADLKNFLTSRLSRPESLRLRRLYHYCRPAMSDPGHPAVRLLAGQAEKYSSGSRVGGALFSCDLYALTEVGKMPAVVFGPAGGGLHAPDEWVDLDSLDACLSTLADFIPAWCG